MALPTPMWYKAVDPPPFAAFTHYNDKQLKAGRLYVSVSNLSHPFAVHLFGLYHRISFVRPKLQTLADSGARYVAQVLCTLSLHHSPPSPPHLAIQEIIFGS